MKRLSHTIVILLAYALVAVLSSCGTPSGRSEVVLRALPHTERIPVNGLLEITFRDITASPRSFFEGQLVGYFISPDGSRHVRTGFYRGSGLWMIRYRPNLAGNWSYRAVFERDNSTRDATGRFLAVLPAVAPSIRRDPENPNRWAFTTGEPYFPLGIQDCVEFVDGEDDAFFSIDGEGRNDGKARRLASDEYFSVYAAAGFNLFRFSQRNCSPPLFASLDSYNEREMHLTDKLLDTARKHGFRVVFGFFGYHGHWYGGSFPGKVWHALRVRSGFAEEALRDPTDASTIAKEKRFMNYAVARWGEYADFWELLNERRAHPEWIRAMATYVHSIDPGRKPVTTSWDEPDIAELDFIAPHWYVSEPPSESDLRVVDVAGRWKKYGKPVLIGEHGNAGMNWDPGSADRMRVRLWTALFQELGVVLWNTSWSKHGMFEGQYTPGHAANIYLGPQERGYTRALTSFESRLQSGLRRAPVKVSSPGEVRAYGLSGIGQTAVYLWHFNNPAVPIWIDLALPSMTGIRNAKWIDPRTGEVVAAVRLAAGQDLVRTPPFAADLALLISHPMEAK